MLIIYAIIGAFLMVIGVVSVSYFIHFLKKEHLSGFSIGALSEAFGTLVIGLFYIYTSFMLENHDENPYLGFYPLEETFMNSSGTINEQMFINPTLIAINNTSTSKHANTEENTNKEFDSDMDFLTKYNNFFKQIIQQKIASNHQAFPNKTIYFNNKKYRSLENNFNDFISNSNITFNFTEECSKEVFLKHAMLVYSFIHSVISLYNCSNNCLNCSCNDEDTNAESGEKPKDEVKTKHNMDIFLAQSQRNKKANEESGPDDAPETSGIETNESPPLQMDNKIKLALKILLEWILPSIALVALYFCMNSEQKIEHNDLSLAFKNTQSNIQLLELINNPINITTQDKKDEINNIVKNVYNIVESARKNVTASASKSPYKPAMFNIVHFLNKYRQPKDSDIGDCSISDISMKIHTFIIFYISYVMALLYSKITQIKVKYKNQQNSKLLNIYIITFFTMWLPSILDLFSRVFLSTKSSALITDTFLMIGNLFLTMSPTNNYVLAKRLINGNNFVNPSTK